MKESKLSINIMIELTVLSASSGVVRFDARVECAILPRSAPKLFNAINRFSSKSSIRMPIGRNTRKIFVSFIPWLLARTNELYFETSIKIVWIVLIVEEYIIGYFLHSVPMSSSYCRAVFVF